MFFVKIISYGNELLPLFANTFIREDKNSVEELKSRTQEIYRKYLFFFL